ncbi:uncharacterized protein LOC117127691 [Brassica rapa]|uniref:uncharacterized protein LOC117127691 n=1 Tax=Brassica campestris TaxID=3711 RepID=UPI00142D663F|nr:uncharacterized protein LOC117127691 [Brassica rapa]
MAQEDYNLDMNTESVELTYSLQQMAPDLPPIHVTSDRQVRNLLEITKTHEGDEAEEGHEAEVGDKAEDHDGEEDADIPVVADAEDYSEYGKVKDEDEEEDDEIYRIYVNQSFASKDAVLSELRLTAVRRRFSFRIFKSTKTLFVATCRVSGCQWKVRASVKHGTKTFWVTKYLATHTCSIPDRIAQRKCCTPKYIGRLFIDRVGIIDGLNPQHIKDAMKNMFGMTFDYTTSYRALLYAQEMVRGSAEEGLIRGFKYQRRVIVVDGTHLSGKYGGTMLVAAAQDGNFQIYPLAFGIVDGENDESWEWFFTKLASCVSDEYPLVIVSDRHASIINACEKVFPWATRGICYYHLQENIVKKYKGKHLLYLVKGAAYAHTLYDFDRYMDEIRSANPDLAEYLEEADVTLWSRVHCQGDRYNLKTSNIAESINSALKRARGFPIQFLLEFIREKLGRWYWKRRGDALSLTTQHSRGVEHLLAVREENAYTLRVQQIDGWKFFVKGGNRDCNVDLELQKCDCGVYQVEKIPCSHAIAAGTAAGVHISTLVWPVYSKDTLFAGYSENIYPCVGQLVEARTCFPPEVKRGPGRQKKSRWQSWLELSRMRGRKPRKQHRVYRCSVCKETGHKRPQCKN